jgi:hypothetical protein
MKVPNYKKYIFTTVALILVSTIVCCQNSNEEKYYTNNNRKWLAEIPIWVPSIRGQLSYSDFDFSSSGSREEKDFKRLNSDAGLEFYFVGRISVKYNKIWVQADAFAGGVSSAFSYTSIINNNENEFVNIRVKGVIPRFVLGHSIWEKSTKNSFKIELIPYIGVRYVSLNLQSDVFDTDNKIDARPNRFEPLIGLYAPFVYKRFKLEVQFDYGLNETKNSWAISNRYRYRISKLVDVQLGWNFLSLNYEGIIDEEKIEATMRLFGPSVGIGFRF